MYRLPISGNERQIVSFDGQLRWANRSKRIDHPEPIPPPRRNSEHFQRCVGHESGVGVPELSLSVDEQALRVLARVHGQPSRETLRSVFVHPVTEEHHVGGQVVVVEVAVRVFGRRLADDDAAVETAHLLKTRVGVPEVGACVTSYPLVSR